MLAKLMKQLDKAFKVSLRTEALPCNIVPSFFLWHRGLVSAYYWILCYNSLPWKKNLISPQKKHPSELE